jgi:glycosyltransferase involved in cell wall biosynthesis
LRRLGRRAGLDYGYRYGIDEWYDPAIDDHAQRLLHTIRPDAVLVEYVFLSRVLKSFPPSVLKLIDTQDVFGNRHRRYLANGQEAAWFSTTPMEEARALQRADIVLAIQCDEAAYFRSTIRHRVITVGHVVAIHKPAIDQVANRRVLVVGSDNPINVLSLHRFVADVLPRIRAQVADVELAVAGTLCRKAAELRDVTLLGELPDLLPAYDSARVVINPVLFGTGLKVKSVEALGYGKPLVTTSSGADGLTHGAPHALRIADNPDRFAKEVVAILTHDDVAANLGNAALGFASAWNHDCIRELSAILGSAGSRLLAEAETS